VKPYNWMVIYTPQTEEVFKVLPAITVVAVMIYEGFAINYISGIPFWNSSLLLVTFMSWAITSGFSLVSFIASVNDEIARLTSTSWVHLSVTTALTIFYFCNVLYADAKSNQSMKEIVGSPLFWVAIIVGIVFPLVIFFNGVSLSAVLVLTLLFCEIISTLVLAYGVFKTGFYRPLL
jgi:formate-dependent nitrite reductase membrane component NrfD